MIANFSEYISRYLLRTDKSAPPTPGEHHFVCVYLVPRLFTINGKVPDYINPDGTKSILGDVVYYRDGRHHFGIEVKLGTVRLTKREFNEWVVSDDTRLWPNLFVGISNNGIALAAWSEFRGAYLAAVRAKDDNWSPAMIESGYGPMKGVNELSQHLPSGAWFPFAVSQADASMHETAFTTALRRGVESSGGLEFLST